MNNITLDPKELQDILSQSKTVEQNYSTLRGNYEKFRKMYFMQWDQKPRNSEVDANDWKITPSPSARNEVVGMKRLLDTSELNVNVMEGQAASANSDKLERGLKRIVETSGDGKRARVLSDAVLSASLYGPVILTADFYSDMIATTKIPYVKRHYEKQQKKAPAVIKVLNAEECSFEFNDGLLLFFLRKYSMRGSQMKVRFGELAGKPITDSREYIIRDIYTPEHRVVEAEGYGTLMAKPHMLTCIPVAIGFSGGSELFFKPEEQINPFLYAKMKSELWERETSLLTSIFTNVNMRGLLGPAFAVDPENTPETIKVDYAGGMRIIRAKATPIDDKIIDPVVFSLMDKIDDLNGQSTIYRQTLGENINAGTFSGLAMLSSSGKLPLIDPERALQQAFGDIFDYVLYRIKEDPIENDLIKPTDIPDSYELEVSFKPKLPQDDLRNSQIATQLQGLVSEEWIQSNLLQINDSASMRKQIFKERMYEAIAQNMTQNPQFIQPLIQQILGMQGQQGQGGQGQSAPQRQPQQPPMPDQQQQPPDLTQPQGQANMEQTPQTDAMIPPEQRQ